MNLGINFQSWLKLCQISNCYIKFDRNLLNYLIIQHNFHTCIKLGQNVEINETICKPLVVCKIKIIKIL